MITSHLREDFTKHMQLYLATTRPQCCLTTNKRSRPVAEALAALTITAVVRCGMNSLLLSKGEPCMPHHAFI